MVYPLYRLARLVGRRWCSSHPELLGLIPPTWIRINPLWNAITEVSYLKSIAYRGEYSMGGQGGGLIDGVVWN